MMNKKVKIISIITILTMTIMLGLIVYLPSNQTIKDKIQNNCIHIDSNIDMICDNCNSNLPFDKFMKHQNLEATSEDNTVAKISGNMPQNTNAKITNITKEEAINLVQNKVKLNQDDVIGAYDISLNTSSIKYQPGNYNKSVKVELSNVKIDLDKHYAMLHILDNNKYEIIPIQKINRNKISFDASSFSTYILIRVEGHTLTFEGENYKVYDILGNEITDGAEIASGTNLAFTIIPNDGYGVTDVVCTNLTSDMFNVTGNVNLKSGTITTISQDLTIDITTVAAPKIITEPTSTKAKIGGTGSFTIETQNVTTYQWQYRDSSESGWTNVETNGTSATVTVNVTEDISGREFRCLLGNDYFTDAEMLVSDSAMLFVADDEITFDLIATTADTVLPIIKSSPTSQKIKIGEIATFTIEAENVVNYKWQYKTSNDLESWLDVDENLGTSIALASGFDTKTLSIDTSSLSLNEETLEIANNLSNYVFRCVLTNENSTTIYKKSDSAFLSIAQDDIVVENIKTAIPSSIQIEDEFSVTYSETKTLDLNYVGDGTLTVTSNDSNIVEATISGDNLTITAKKAGTTTITITSINNQIYTVINKTITIVVNEKAITITAKNQTITYGENIVTGIEQVDVTPLVSGDILSSVKLTPSTANAGTGVITPSDAKIMSGTTDVTSNYDITYKTGVLTIDKAAGKVELSETSGSLTYPTEGSFNVITNLSNGDLSVKSSNENVVKASINGTKVTLLPGTTTETATITVTSAATDNYSEATATYSVTVVNGTQEVQATAYEGIYDGGAHGITVIATDSTITYSTSENGTYGSENPTYTNAGTYTTYYKVERAGYETVSGSANVIISSKAITITAKPQTIISGSNILTETSQVNVVTLVDGDSLSEITLTSSITEAGTGEITPSDAKIVRGTIDVTSNYSIIYETGELVIYAAEGALITKWTIPVDADGVQATTGIPGTTIKLPIPSNSNNSFFVEWGDGKSETFDGTVNFPTHTYQNTENKVCTIKIIGKVNKFGYTKSTLPTKDTEENYYTFTQYLTNLDAWGELEITQYGFAQCTSLTGSIPNPTANSFIDVTDMSLLFYNCRNINGNISEDLFKSATKVNSFESVFEDCTGLEGAIPKTLFVKNTEAITFANAFSGCTKLTGMVPAELFIKNNKATNFEGTFKNCINITAAELQLDTNVVTNMNEMFSGCTSLESIVLGENFKNVTGTNMFEKCSLLRAIIMLNNPETTADIGTIANVETLGLAARTVIYVPYEEDEILYEQAVTNITPERIDQVIEANEPNPDYVGLNQVYVDKGYTVAGFGMDETDKYTQYGFYVVVEGADDLDTSKPGSEWVKYRLRR